MKKETFEILKPIFQSIDNNIIADSFVDNLDGTYNINTCNTKWLTFGYTITIDGNDYIVVDLLVNSWVKIKGSVMPISKTFSIYTPKIFHGTILATNEELLNIQNSWDKFPMIYLHEITRERYDRNVDSSIDRNSDCDIYFLVDCNMQDWIISDHYRYAIQPMRNLLFETIKAIEASNVIGLLDTFDVFDHMKFGVYVTDSGHTKQIFKDHLSGTQLKINIPILKIINCNNNCNN